MNSEISSMKFNNGDTYIGQFRSDRVQGLGYFLAREFKCEGEWSDGLLNGFGRQIGPNQQLYTGEFARGGKSGVGKLEERNRLVYGHFLDDVLHGFCMVNDNQKGSDAMGTFKEGFMFGFGMIKSKNTDY